MKNRFAPNYRSILAILPIMAICLLTGCFTVYQTDFPEAEMTPIAESSDVKVQLSGFEAVFTTVTPVHSYTTVTGFGDYHHGHRHHSDFGSQTYSSTTYIPQQIASRRFLDEATDLLEGSGFIVVSGDADYIVDLSYSGPVTTGGTNVARFCTVVFSLLTGDYDKEIWTARMKVREAKSGKVILMKNYEQEYAVGIWGPIPLFSPLLAEATDSDSMKIWSLAALTKRAISDASAFLAARNGAPAATANE